MSSWTFTDLCEEFLEMETDLDLLDETIADVYFWERIRFFVHKRLSNSLGVSEGSGGNSDGYAEYISGIRLLLRNTIQRNPFFAPDADLLFYGKGRRKNLDDGVWWDIYIDPILEYVDSSTVCLERPYDLSHARPAKTESLRYTDLILYTGTLLQELGVSTTSMTETESALLERIESEIHSRFGVQISLSEMVLDDLARRQVRLPLYRRVIERVNPEVAFLTSSYNGRETFVEACQAEDVPVVELQHGVITEYHMGYSFPYDNKNVFPDYFFSFGEYWSEAVNLPLPEEKVLPVGYPFIEERVSEYRHHETKDQVVVISQPHSANRLSQFALKLSRSATVDDDVVYKLHPKEYTDYQERYPHLVTSSVVVSAGELPLYELLAESKAQIGVNSTALFEGLRFGLETYVLDEPGAEYMEYLLSNGHATKIRSTEEYLANRAANRNDPTVDNTFFFARNWLENFQNAVNRITR